MSTDLQNAYQEAVQRYQLARQRLNGYVNFLHEVVWKTLHTGNDWVRTSISSCGHWPLEGASGQPTQLIDGNLWPTKEQVAEALRAAQQARQEVQRAWQALPCALREGLKPPAN